MHRPISPGYPRKIAVLSTVGFIETTVNDLLPEPVSMIALFQVGQWSTRDMRMQVFETFKPYLHSNEDTWIFGFHEGKYQARKALWHYTGYASASWSDLLAQIVRCYYTYAEKGETHVFEVGDKVRFKKPLLVAHGDERVGLVGHVMPWPDRGRAYSVGLVPVHFPESNHLWYLKPEDLEFVR